MNENIREFKGNCLYKFLKDYIVIDIETTGLSPKYNEIIEIAAIKVRENEIVEKYSVLIKPNEKIPESIEQLTGITNQMAEHDGIDIKSALIDFNKFISNDILVGHNVNFDINFLYDNCLNHLEKPLTNNFVDTLKISQNLIKDTYNWKLSTLAQKYKINNVNAHRALNDVIVTNELYKKLSSLPSIKELNTTNSVFSKKQTGKNNIFDYPKPTKEEMKVCAYIQNVILKNGGDSDFLGFVKNSGKYINVTYLYSIIKFKISKNGKYFIVDSKVAKKTNLHVEDCSKSECSPFFLRVFFDSVADLKELDSYIFRLYKQNRRPALDYLKSHPIHKDEYLNGPEMYNKIPDSELESMLN